MFYLIIACALALVVQIGVAVAWSTWWTQSLRALQRCTELVNARIDRTAQSQLRVEVDALAANVEKLSRSNRRELGRIWAEVHELRTRDEPPEEGAWPPPEELDDVAGAMIRDGGVQQVKIGTALQQLGVTRAGGTGLICSCGWCASCQDRKIAAGGPQ